MWFFSVTIAFLLFFLAWKYVSTCKNTFATLRILNAMFPKNERAVFSTATLSWTGRFRDNWMAIRNEYSSFCETKSAKLYQTIDRFGSSHCDLNQKWHVVFLKAFNNETKWAEQFPFTMNLIRQVPTCTLAFFSVLKPNAYLAPHRGVYAGVHRYHLSLQVPKHGTCTLNVNGEQLHWQEGQDILFDDMFEHSARNTSKTEDRVVLFMDIKRDFGSFFLNKLNDMILRCISTNDALVKFVEDA